MVEARPALRGQFHLLMALVSPAALLVLVLIADSPREYVGGAIFGVSLLLLFSTSSVYHLVERGQALLQRIDRSMIFVLIAGTYTPFCLVLLEDGWSTLILSLVWGLAAVGIASKAVHPTPPRWLNLALYLGLGWIGLVAIAPFASAASSTVLALLLAGGVLYSLGGVVHARRRPDPFPGVFGYHELFHLLTALAGLTYYATAVYAFG
ncbi:MAG: hemolysin III family protein [Chloroflexi bacterium]|nr:hemolysin III family protein [Chloroflexota bacterium]